MANEKPNNGGTDAPTDAGTADAAAADIGSGSERGGDALDGILEQFGEQAGYRLQLERIDPVDGAAYLGTLPLDNGLVDVVQQRFGGGKYAGKIVDSRSKYVRRMPAFRIAGDARDPKAAAAAPATAEPVGMVAAITAALAGFSDRITDAIRTAQQPAPVVPAVDPMAMLTQVLQLAKELQPKQQDSGNVVGMMRDLMELQGELRGDSRGESDGVAGAIREFAPIVKTALENREREPVPPVNQPPVIQRPPAANVAEWLRPFMQYRGLLLSYADQGKNPQLYAGLIADNISDQQATLIAQAVSAGTMEKDLFDAVPQLNQSDDRRRFAGGLLAALRVELFGEEKKARRGKKRATKKASAGASSV